MTTNKKTHPLHSEKRAKAYLSTLRNVGSRGVQVLIVDITLAIKPINAKFEERYSFKTIRGSRNSDNVDGRGWNERRMSNVGNNRGNWRNSEVVSRPNNGRNDYRGNYENSRQGNQWFESRNRFQNDDRRFNDRRYQFRNQGTKDDFNREDQRNRGSSENFSQGDRRQRGRLNVKVSDVKDKPGLTHVLYHEIDTGHNPPVVSRPYRYDRVKVEILDYHVDKMLKEGTIIPIQSPYASPVVLCRQNNGLPPDNPEAYGFADDYRKLNAITKYLRYPLSLIDDLIMNIPHTGIMSALDLRSGYFRMAVNPSDIVKTAFVTKNGTYAFRKMPFGLLGAAPNFQKAIDISLKPVIGMFVNVYMDDVIISFPSFTQHIEHLKDVFRLLHEGLGAVLNQEQRPEVFASRTLSAAKRNYTVTERECLGVVWALNKFRTYLGSLPIKIITDHASLTRLKHGKNLSNRMIRLALKLAEFNIEWEHRSETQNAVANVLSRNPIGNRKLITAFQKLVRVSDGTEFAFEDIERLFEEARRNTKAKHEKWEKYYNRRRRDVQIKKVWNKHSGTKPCLQLFSIHNANTIRKEPTSLHWCQKWDCPKNKEVDNKRLNVNKVSTEGTELVDGTVAARVDLLGKVIPRGAIEDKLSKLVKTSISVDGKLVHALVDTGTEITVIKKDLVPRISVEGASTIYLKGIFGPAVKCPLVYVPIGLATGGQVNVVLQQVLCALAEVLVEDVLLPPEVLDILGGAQSEENSLAQSSQDLRVDSGNVDETEVSLGILPGEAQEHIEDSQRNITSCRNEVGTLGTKDEEVTAEMDKGSMVADSFRSEQECCAELALAWKYAKEGKGNYYEVDGYLFRRDKILGESIGQLVIPKCRRTEVLKLAHTSVFSSHMGPKKTLERIKYSLFWEGLSSNGKKFCESCKECQLTRSVRIKDRSPITPVARSELPFQVVNMDLIGPIDPPSSKGHTYILCLVDQHTRWGEARPVTSLSAKVLRMLEQFVVSRIVDIDILMQIWKNRVKQSNCVLEWVRWVGSEIIPAKGKLEP
ncbi:retrovirus-related Pol polyprotein from transposon 297 [Trichonephila clavipes]|nr:retrovirus-related Pol polyprotein from transposon 297 [Trichonephila clavipes]